MEHQTLNVREVNQTLHSRTPSNNLSAGGSSVFWTEPERISSPPICTWHLWSDQGNMETSSKMCVCVLLSVSRKHDPSLPMIPRLRKKCLPQPNEDVSPTFGPPLCRLSAARRCLTSRPPRCKTGLRITSWTVLFSAVGGIGDRTRPPGRSWHAHQCLCI